MNGVKFENGKFCGYVNGKLVVKTSSKYYAQRKVDEMMTEVSAQPAPIESEFGINERFGFVEKTVQMVAKGTMASCVITGAGGLGKSYTVMKALKASGLRDVSSLSDLDVGSVLDLKKCFRVIKGFSTAKGLYRTLFECNKMTIVFDDTDSILKDPVALNLLKGALDSYSRRIISWNADMRDDDLPRSFDFTGRVIFISNMEMEKVDQAIRTRSLCLDLSMTESQKIDRMEVIAKSPEFLPEIEKKTVDQALDFLRGMIGVTPNLSLRTLIQVSKIANEGGDWKSLAKYVLSQGH